MDACPIEHSSEDNIRGLGTEFPGQDVVSWDRPAGCVTAYGAVKGQPKAQVVRWNLFAELKGIRQLLGSAFQSSGGRGIVVTASGMIADSYHLSAQATSSRVTIKAALIACDGCSPPSVVVPSSNQEPPANTVPGGVLPPGMIITPPAPFQDATGEVLVRDEEPIVGTAIRIGRDERIFFVNAYAAGGGTGTFEIAFRRGFDETIHVPRGQRFSMDIPQAGLRGVTLFSSFANILAIQVMSVR